ncbi:MAG: hypothetical protein CW346_03235 [Bacillaceae bacterium]|nr:hypothetical protein [Bacillaceae bacterium]
MLDETSHCNDYTVFLKPTYFNKDHFGQPQNPSNRHLYEFIVTPPRNYFPHFKIVYLTFYTNTTISKKDKWIKAIKHELGDNK